MKGALVTCIYCAAALGGAQPLPGRLADRLPDRLPDRLKDARLEAVHEQRIEWKKKRPGIAEPEGVYQDFRAVILSSPVPADSLLEAARAAGLHAVLGSSGSGLRDGILFVNRREAEFRGFELPSPAPLKPADWKRLAGKLSQFPDEALGAVTEIRAQDVSPWDATEAPGYAKSTWPEIKLNTESKAALLRNVTTHILARELKEPQLLESLESGHAYVAHDWLCDPSGFSFVAENYFGSFEMGDTIVANPLLGETTLTATVPVLAKMRLLRNGTLVAEAHDTKLVYRTADEGAYRLEAALTVDGEDRPWIYSNAMYIRRPWDIRLPSGDTPPNVEVRNDIYYVDEARDGKQRLDLYLPKDKRNFPVLLFLHGGGWISGDRSLYHALGNRLARAGIGVAIPSYRLMPRHAHPAQMEDVAAAFAWVHANIAQFGGDVSHFYVAGHSSGGHLASLLALDPKYLKPFDLEPSAILGVISMSGVYNVDHLLTFAATGDRSDASPMHHVHSGAPRFLVSYCQWDYLGLPRQARNFTAALKKAFIPTDLIYVPRDNHITEIINVTKEDSPLLHAILNFVQ